jgi:hypothetical protein
MIRSIVMVAVGSGTIGNCTRPEAVVSIFEGLAPLTSAAGHYRAPMPLWLKLRGEILGVPLHVIPHDRHLLWFRILWYIEY